MMSEDNPNYSIVEKSTGNLRKIIIIKTPVKDCQLTLLRKTLKK